MQNLARILNLIYEHIPNLAIRLDLATHMFGQGYRIAQILELLNIKGNLYDMTDLDPFLQ